MALGHSERQYLPVSRFFSLQPQKLTLNRFFKFGAQRAKPYLNTTVFTMAMRGSGDTAIPLSTEGAVLAVEGAVAAQEEILADVFKGVIDTKDIPKMWCLYKEVQYYYEQGGLDVPDDITLLWVSNPILDLVNFCSQV